MSRATNFLEAQQGWLALPGKAGVAPLAVVTQTLVELCLLVALTALVRRVPQG